MLRISISEAACEQVTLQLDGQVSGQWVELLRSTCEGQLKKNARLAIDLRNVCFLDHDGIALLRSLKNRQVEILNAVPFIAGQIGKAGLCGDAQ